MSQESVWEAQPTDLQVGVHSQLLVHQPVSPLVPRSPVHDVTLSFLVGQRHRGDLQQKQTIRGWAGSFCLILRGLAVICSSQVVLLDVGGTQRREGSVWIPLNV